MFRINITHYETEGGIRSKIRYKPLGYEKFIRLSGSADDNCYTLMRSCKELFRDILFDKYGHDYRKAERKHYNQLHKSMVRAIKFAGGSNAYTQGK